MYLLDQPCPSGHRSLRYTSNAACLACLKVTTAQQVDALERGTTAPKTCRKCQEPYVGRQCPACRKRGAAAWRAQNRDALAARQRQRTAAVRDYVRAERSKPCTDCGEQYPWYIMEFDHRHGRPGGRADLVASLVGQGNLERAKIEIAKCDLVCANCHRARTHARRTEEGHAVPTL